MRGTNILDSASLLALALGTRPADLTTAPRRRETDPGRVPVGSWCSADGAVRLEIKTDGTYAGMVAGRRRTAHGTYDVDGGTMTLHDDSGLRTAVLVADGALTMAGHRLAPARTAGPA